MSQPDYDAVLIVSFGGPEGRDEVIPFLENVLRGRNVPRERLLEVAEHYYHFDGISPINQQNRELVAALEAELHANGIKLPVFFGNRNWHPLLADTLRTMRDRGLQRALAFFTSSFSSYSGCRQYRENIAAAQDEVGAGAPRVEKLRAHFNHPGFIETMVARTAEALNQFDADAVANTHLAFTAHSIPLAMAQNCRYEAQLREACRLVAEAVGMTNWKLVFQSRSGPPTQPWLEPDIGDHLREIASQGVKQVVIVPIGFISDHMEVLYDLDCEARQIADELSMQMVRAKTAGVHPRFVQMIRELILERTTGATDRPALGQLGPSHDVCPEDCCLSGRPTTRQ